MSARFTDEQMAKKSIHGANVAGANRIPKTKRGRAQRARFAAFIAYSTTARHRHTDGNADTRSRTEGIQQGYTIGILPQALFGENGRKWEKARKSPETQYMKEKARKLAHFY